MVKFITVASVVVFCCMAVTAQNHRMQLKGKVLDRQTQAAVSGANISIAGTRRGCVTNKDGEFSLVFYYPPVYMNVSHVGYETQKIWLDSTSKSITVLLIQSVRLLQEVEVKAKNEPQPFFKDNKYTVLDYEVDSNRVYLLIYRFRLKKSELLYKSLDGDTIARSGSLPFKPSGLFLDCMGNVHVLNEDSSYQVYRHGDTLDLCCTAEIGRFRSFLADCVASTDSLLFFRTESPDQLSVEFYQVNRQTSRRQILSSVSDKEKLKMLSRNPEDYRYLVMENPPRNYEDVLAWQWLKKIIYGKNTSSLHRIDELLCIFNTADYTLELFTMGGVFTSRLKMPIPDIGANQWTSDIYIDKIDHRAYTSFLKSGGYFTLYRINLNTGELKQILGAEHGFPQKVRVHKNYLYYLYETPGGGDNRLLYRQKL